MNNRFVLAASCAVAAISATAVFYVFDSSDPQFESAEVQRKFCTTATAMDLQNSRTLTPAGRQEVISELARDAPEELRPSFDTVLDWYAHPHPADEERFDQAARRVGELVERSCPVNVGGIRT
ncbi:hypothetical protein [Streptomyces agglomeratus]|uniref:hypothetical protein n=1 Tax=Streptomyces agglomeratus TaxID=285458 RepID=UPI00114CB91D|nr:hypothetical protein [Streptomyces agglomeratus]